MQLLQLHKLVGAKLANDQQNLMIILDQIMIVCGSYGALSTGAQKWIFFIIALAVGFALWGQVYMLTRENYKNFPNEAKTLLLVWTGENNKFFSFRTLLFSFVSIILLKLGYQSNNLGAWSSRTKSC